MSAAPRPLPDAADRFAAATDLDTNVVVVAGAGTGKTSLLVARALVAIGAGRLPVERLLAITFTEKAAAELRERLTQGLEDLFALAGGPEEPGSGRHEAARVLDWLVKPPAGSAVPMALVRERARTALASVEEAFVGTIHGFAAELLRRHPREAGVDPYFEVDEGPKLARLHREEWPAFLARELGPDGRRPEVWAAALGRFTPADLEDLALALLAAGAPPERTGPEQSEQGAAARLLSEPARHALVELLPLLSEGLNPAPRAWVEQALPLLESLAGGGPEGLREASSSVDASFWSRDAPLGKGIGPTFLKEESERRIKTARRLLSLARQVDGEALDGALEAVRPYALEAAAAALHAGFLSFDALLTLARDLLRRHPAVLDEERGRVGMLLVDEFQDTDPVQYDIALLIAGRRGEREIEPFRIQLEPGRLFIVGDPKQSIYRFRGADIVAYERAIARVLDQGGRKVVLRSNFRSHEEVLRPLNLLFRRAFSRAQPPIQPYYEPIESAKNVEGAAGRPRVTILSIDPGDHKARADGQRLREGQAIAREMMREREEVGKKEGRRRKWSEMALLLPAMTVAPFYARALRELGIPFVMEGGRTFGAKTEVRMMLSLLSAVASPHDPVAFLAVARSPLGAAPDTELARFVAAGSRLPVLRPVDGEAFPGIARTQRLLQDLRATASRSPVDETVRAIIESTPVFPLLAVGYEGAQRVANLRSLTARACALARGGGLSLEATVEALRQEFEGKDTGEAPLADERLEAVRVLTVHRAKGLEFPVVFVGDLRRDRGHGRGPDGRDARARWTDSGLALGVGGSASRVLSAAEALARMEEPHHEAAESIRCFYVACTRAADRLLLVQSDPEGAGAWARLLEAWGYECSEGAYPPEGSLIEGLVEHRIVSVPGERHGSSGLGESLPDFQEAVAAFDRARKSARAADTPWVKSPSRLQAGASEKDADNCSSEDPDEQQLENASSSRGARPDANVAAAAGSAVHSLLELWDRTDLSWFVRSAGAFAAREAARRGLSSERVGAEVKKILDAFLASPLPGKLASVEVIGREVPFLHPRQGVLMHGVADLLYREADGTFVVADYKTDLPAADGLPSLVRHYGPQMSAYTEALRSLLSPEVSVRAEIWFCRSGEIVPVQCGTEPFRS